MSPFLIKTLDQHLMRGHSLRQVFSAILPQEVELGAHTGVVLLEQHQQLTYVWTHPGVRPWGFEVRPQCDQCLVLKPWKVTWEEWTIILKCRCGYELRFIKPPGLIIFGGKPNWRSTAGIWGYQTYRIDSTNMAMEVDNQV
jgi:hypothetical protein